MSRKPETEAINRVNRHIRKEVHIEKTNNPFRSGTADCWYSGDQGDLWIEYKYLMRTPSTKIIIPELTYRQHQWLYERWREGRNVAVVVMCPDGGVVLRAGEWMQPLTAQEFRDRIESAESIALWIKSQTGVRVCASPTLFTLLQK